MAGAMVLAGCGTQQAAQTTASSSQASSASSEATAETSEASVYDQDMEAYADIIGGLEAGQAYAFADMDENHDALLVAADVYDDLDGNKVAIAATIYGFDKDGNIMEYGTVESTDTGYPLSVVDGCLIFGGNHHIGMEFIDEENGSIITKEDASETFDKDGNATYYYFSLEEEFEGEVEDNSHMSDLNGKYADATPIVFTVVE